MTVAMDRPPVEGILNVDSGSFHRIITLFFTWIARGPKSLEEVSFRGGGFSSK